MKFIEVKTTFEVEEEANQMADFLVRQKLVACGQVFKIESSRYVWKGELVACPEFMLVMKTRKSLFSKLERAIKSKHSYEVAEMIATPICAISKEYAQWIEQNTET